MKAIVGSFLGSECWCNHFI